MVRTLTSRKAKCHLRSPQSHKTMTTTTTLIMVCLLFRWPTQRNHLKMQPPTQDRLLKQKASALNSKWTLSRDPGRVSRSGSSHQAQDRLGLQLKLLRLTRATPKALKQDGVVAGPS